MSIGGKCGFQSRVNSAKLPPRAGGERYNISPRFQPEDSKPTLVCSQNHGVSYAARSVEATNDPDNFFHIIQNLAPAREWSILAFGRLRWLINGCSRARLMTTAIAR